MKRLNKKASPAENYAVVKTCETSKELIAVLMTGTKDTLHGIYFAMTGAKLRAPFLKRWRKVDFAEYLAHGIRKEF